MYAERRIAFENRTRQIFEDHGLAYPSTKKLSNNERWDLAARIMSALEDSFQMGKKDSEKKELP